MIKKNISMMALLFIALTIAAFVEAIDNNDQLFESLSPEKMAIYIDSHLTEIFACDNEIPLRKLSDAYIQLNGDNNVDMRITGTTTILGILVLPGLTKNTISGYPIVVNAAGQLGVACMSSQYTFSSSAYFAPGTTLYVNGIDPRSPTTTTTFSGSISLPGATTANHGSLQINGTPFLHNYGTNNTFAGANAGNLTMSGSSNTALGSGSLHVNTSGGSNIAIGANAGNTLTSGSNNIDIGNVGVAGESSTIRIGTSGTQTACYVAGITGVSVTGSPVLVTSSGRLGAGSVTSQYTFSSNAYFAPGTTLYVNDIDPRSPTTTTTFSGSISLPTATTSNHGSLQINGTPFLHNYGTNNTFAGANAGNLTMSGSSNTALGSGSLSANTSGGSNIAIGANAGNTLTSGSNNIDIGNVGVAAESNTIRVGTSGTQTACYVAGISGTTIVGSPVSVSTTGQLGVVLSSRKYKDDIHDMNSASNNLMKLRPVIFRYKDLPEAPEQYGLIAEEVAEVYPDLVIYKDNEPESVRYDALPAMLLNEYQYMRKELDELTDRLKKIDAQLQLS